MSRYKVPQDVEADDKLLGPFSFRQFIFLIIAVIAAALTYFLGTILLPLALIPLPVAIFFFVLAIPLRKDQPTEVYLAAILSFYLKPKKKIWQADGVDNIVKITYENVKDDTIQLKDLSYEQAQERLAFLANVVDTEGWAVKNAQKPGIKQEFINEANTIEDIQDENTSINQSFNQMINDSKREQKAEIITKMNQVRQQVPTTQPSVPSNPTPPANDIQREIENILNSTPDTSTNNQATTPIPQAPIPSPAPTPVSPPPPAQPYQPTTSPMTAPPTLPQPPIAPEPIKQVPEPPKNDIINTTNKNENPPTTDKNDLLGGEDEISISLR